MNVTLPLLATGGNTTGFEIPERIVEQLGGGKKPKVAVTLNGSHSYRSSIAVMGGKYMLGVSSAHRQAAGVAAGDEVEIDLALDTAPRDIEVPEDLVQALSTDPGAREAFDRLAFSHRQRHVLSVTDAKTAETRARRIARVVEAVTSSAK